MSYHNYDNRDYKERHYDRHDDRGHYGHRDSDHHRRGHDNDRYYNDHNDRYNDGYHRSNNHYEENSRYRDASSYDNNLRYTDNYNEGQHAQPVEQIFETVPQDSPFSNVVKSVDGYVLFVGNIHPEALEIDIKEAFAEYGEVKQIKVDTDRNGLGKGYCLIQMTNQEHALTAIQSLNGAILLGKPIFVDFAFKKK